MTDGQTFCKKAFEQDEGVPRLPQLSERWARQEWMGRVLKITNSIQWLFKFLNLFFKISEYTFQISQFICPNFSIYFPKLVAMRR